MAIIQRQFWQVFPFKGEGGKRYTNLVLSLVKGVQMEDEEDRKRVDPRKN
jgi:hypothetical protein